MESIDQFWADVQTQAKAAMIMVESAVNDLAPASASKRPTRTVRQPCLRQNAPVETERSQQVEDAMVGVWVYGKREAIYRINVEDGKLIFREGKRKGTLVSSCDGVSLVAKLVRANGDVHGSIKLRLEDGNSVSSFRPFGATLWGIEITGWKSTEDAVAEKKQQRATGSMSERCQKSRAVPEAEAQKAPLKHAKTAPPQELHFVGPEDCTPGHPVCLSGPHGDPLLVPMPEGAEPGKPCSIYLGPKSSIQVEVPEGGLPGTVVLFTIEDDGDMLHTVVPPGKKPGDTFDIVPPVLLIQVPLGSKAGDEVLYTTPTGAPAVVQIPAGLHPGHYFPTLMPVDKEMEAIALKQSEGAPQPRKCSTLQKVMSDAKTSVQGERRAMEGQSSSSSSSGSQRVETECDIEGKSDGEQKEFSQPEHGAEVGEGIETLIMTEKSPSSAEAASKVPPMADIGAVDETEVASDSPTASRPRVFSKSGQSEEEGDGAEAASPHSILDLPLVDMSLI